MSALVDMEGSKLSISPNSTSSTAAETHQVSDQVQQLLKNSRAKKQESDAELSYLKELVTASDRELATTRSALGAAQADVEALSEQVSWANRQAETSRALIEANDKEVISLRKTNRELGNQMQKLGESSSGLAELDVLAMLLMQLDAQAASDQRALRELEAKLRESEQATRDAQQACRAQKEEAKLALEKELFAQETSLRDDFETEKMLLKLARERAEAERVNEREALSQSARESEKEWENRMNQKDIEQQNLKAGHAKAIMSLRAEWSAEVSSVEEARTEALGKRDAVQSTARDLQAQLAECKQEIEVSHGKVAQIEEMRLSQAVREAATATALRDEMLALQTRNAAQIDQQRKESNAMLSELQLEVMSLLQARSGLEQELEALKSKKQEVETQQSVERLLHEEELKACAGNLEAVRAETRQTALEAAQNIHDAQIATQEAEESAKKAAAASMAQIQESRTNATSLSEQLCRAQAELELGAAQLQMLEEQLAEERLQYAKERAQNEIETERAVKSHREELKSAQEEVVSLSGQLDRERERVETGVAQLQQAQSELAEERLQFAREQAQLEIESTAQVTSYSNVARESAAATAIAEDKTQHLTERVAALQDHIQEAEQRHRRVQLDLDREILGLKAELAQAIRTSSTTVQQKADQHQEEQASWSQERSSMQMKHAAEVASLNSALELCQHEHKLAKSALAAEEAKASDLSSRLAASRAKSLEVQQAMEAQLQQRQCQVEDGRRQLAACQQEVGQLRQAETTSEQKVWGLAGDLKERAAEIVALKQQVTQTQATCDSVNMRATALELQVDELKRQKEDHCDSRSTNAEEERSRLEAVIADMQLKMGTHNPDKVERLEQRNAALESEVLDLKAEQEIGRLAWEQELDDRDTSLRDLRLLNGKLEGENEKLRSNTHSSSDLATPAPSESDALGASVKRVGRRRDSLRDTIKSFGGRYKTRPAPGAPPSPRAANDSLNDSSPVSEAVDPTTNTKATDPD